MVESHLQIEHKDCGVSILFYEFFISTSTLYGCTENAHALYVTICTIQLLELFFLSNTVGEEVSASSGFLSENISTIFLHMRYGQNCSSLALLGCIFKTPFFERGQKSDYITRISVKKWYRHCKPLKEAWRKSLEPWFRLLQKFRPARNRFTQKPAAAIRRPLLCCYRLSSLRQHSWRLHRSR